MRIFGLRIHIIALSFVILFGASLAAGYFVYERGVRSPLEDVLEELPGVEAVRVAPEGGWRAVAPSMLRVRLSREARLESVYPAIEEEVRKAAGSRSVQLVLEDRRAPALTAALGEMTFAIEEAMVTGSFREMAGEIETIGSRHDLDAVAVGIDRHRIYVTLTVGEAYLHHVVLRQEDDGTGGGLRVSGAGIGEEVTFGG